MSQNTPDSSSNPSQYNVIPVYEGLRNQIFDIYLESPPSTEVWGVLMETGYAGAVATLVALADSTVSLYFSSGGGIIGAGFQEAPAKTARTLLEHAPFFVTSCQTISTRPLPRPEHTRFYLLTDGKVFSTEAREEEFGYNRHPLSPLFHLAHNLLAELRELSPNE